ncbi:MAG TPA: hypothetical protein EYP33_07040 [Pyrodictium sp.]|nr:hypothetical protein [Pyrodictium sp.]
MATEKNNNSEKKSEAIETKCNPMDVCLTFAYLQYLENTGVLINASPKTIKKMTESTFDKIKRSVEERSRFFHFRKSIKKLPVVNIISKDYMNTVDYKEAYSTPKEKSLKSKHFTFSSLFDISGNVDPSVKERNPEDKKVPIDVPFMLPSSLMVDYDKRGILTLLDNTVVVDIITTQISKRFDDRFLVESIEGKINGLKDFGVSDNLCEKLIIALKKYHSTHLKIFQQLFLLIKLLNMKIVILIWFSKMS